MITEYPKCPAESRAQELSQKSVIIPSPALLFVKAVSIRFLNFEGATTNMRRPVSNVPLRATFRPTRRASTFENQRLHYYLNNYGSSQQMDLLCHSRHNPCKRTQPIGEQTRPLNRCRPPNRTADKCIATPKTSKWCQLTTTTISMLSCR